MMTEEKAYFALACFWKPDAQFGCQNGVLRTRVGYCGGTGPVPNYPKVYDYTETIEIEYDSFRLSFEELLNLFWKFHDPCSCKKKQYMSAIFYLNESQRVSAEVSKRENELMIGKMTETQILPFDIFHEAENYHQKYFLRTYHKDFYSSLPIENPVTSTRDARLNGYLSRYGFIEQLYSEKEFLNLTDDQFEYVKEHFTGVAKSATVLPLIHTVVQVFSSFMTKFLNY